MWNSDYYRYHYSPDCGAKLMIEMELENGPYVRTKATSSKGVVHVTIENHDPRHVGITKAELTINCGSNVTAADVLSYLARDLDFNVSLTPTYGR